MLEESIDIFMTEIEGTLWMTVGNGDSFMLEDGIISVMTKEWTLLMTEDDENS
jgi:hypothetical protein